MKVYEYRPDNGEWHCREGMAVEDDRGLRDTYWGSRGPDDHRLTSTERANARLLFDTDDYEELDQYNPNTPTQWKKYAPEDRAVITSQRGLRNRWFIRTGAGPDRDTILENARADVASAEADLRRAESNLRWAQEQLTELENSRA